MEKALYVLVGALLIVCIGLAYMVNELLAVEHILATDLKNAMR